MSCAACGFVNPPGSRFCGECGATLALACPACGAPHEPGQKFCRSCGATLAEATQPAAGMVAAVPSMAAPSRASSELRFVSVLFVDLVGFTTLSAGREAEDVRELLSRYFDVARGVVERYGGTIEKFIGDAVMAVWGAPVALEDDAERAVRAALEIVDAVAQFGTDVGFPDLRARAGVVTGQAAAVDSPTEGIVVGDRVNTASRVQSAAQPGTVLVDEVSRQLAEAAILFEDDGEHIVRGKAEPLRLWRAVRVVAGAGGRDREGLLEIPFVGRGGELRLLKELLDQTVERAGARLVAISGEAGIGKSRLRREFSNYTDGLVQQFLWHTGRCLAHGEGVAYWALAEMVRQRLGIPEDAPTAVAAAKLDAGLREWITDEEEREYIHPRLGVLLGVASPGLERAELFAGWRLFVERLASHDPVVLVFEDMQWADEGLLEFVDQILDWSRTAPIFMLTLSRPELADRRDGWPSGRRGVTMIELEPLSDAAVAELLESAVDGLPDATRDQVVARAQGNPLYAVETLRALVDRGVLAQRDGRLVAADAFSVDELDVPASLNALLASRLDALEQAERELVKAMSVFGGSFPLQAVITLTELPANRVGPLLETLVRKQVLVIFSDPLSPDRGQYAFAQGLLRTVAYETLGRRTRKRLHLAAAAHLRAAFRDEGEELAEVIANHVLEAYEACEPQDDDHDDLRSQAVAALKRSADRAERVGAPVVACDALGRAAELTTRAEQPELLERAGALAYFGGQYERALTLGEQARDMFAAAGRVRESVLAERQTLPALRNMGRMNEMVARLQAALAALSPLADQLDAGVAELQSRLARSLIFVGDYVQADRLLDEALTVAQALELEEVLVDAFEARGILCQGHLGRPREAQLFYETAVALAETHGSTTRRLSASTNFANFAMTWTLPGARELAEQALELGHRLGSIAPTVVNATNLAGFCLKQGRWTQAEAVMLDLADRDLGEWDRATISLDPCSLALLRGDLETARHRLAEMGVLERSDEPYDRIYVSTLRVRLAAAEGRDEDAVREGLALTQEASRLLGQGTERPDWDAWPWMLEAALALPDADRVNQLLAVFAHMAPGRVPPQHRAQLVRGQGLLAALTGDLETAEVRLRDTIERFGAIEFDYWRAVAEVDLADVLIRDGRHHDAATLLERAIAVLAPLDATPVLTRARVLLEAPTAVGPSAGQRAS